MLAPARKVPAHVVNGLTVAVGIGLVQAVVGGTGDDGVGRLAAIGAICASLPHQAERAPAVARKVAAGGVLGCFTSGVVAAVRPSVPATGIAIAALAFGAMMLMAWGKRAGPLSFAAVLGMVFALPLPAHPPLVGLLATAAGAAFYAAWAIASARWLEGHYRRLALVAMLEATVALLRSRATILVERPGDTGGAAGSAREWDWIAEEARLAEILQNARDLAFPVAATPEDRRRIAIVLRTIEIRDILLASRLDLDLLGNDGPARAIRSRLAGALETAAAALALAARAMRTGTRPEADASERLAAIDRVFRDVVIAPSDRRTRLLPVLASRLRHLGEEAARVHALLRGADEPLPLDAGDLRRFVIADPWSLEAIRANLVLSSPVFRHALRSALALGSVHVLAYALPWAPHPYWLVLSVAVVLRGTLDQTLARRNARVLGTALGCVVVLGAALLPALAQRFSFALAAGIAHAFVNVNYVLTATAATVMALLQARGVGSQAAFPIVERLADTVAGAGLAWGFSYVFPSWERRTLPRAIERAVASLHAYAGCALAIDDGFVVEQRLARQRAYDALEGVLAAVQRSRAEPRRVRPPLDELQTFLDHAQRLVAHLSSLRLLLSWRREHLEDEAARAALAAARASFDALLAPPEAGFAGTSGPPSTRPELPAEPADQRALPWLLRRLEVSVHDARRVAEAARAALERLSSPAT